jgi:hypothetical protein
MARDIGAEPGKRRTCICNCASSLSDQDAVTKRPQRPKICAAS